MQAQQQVPQAVIREGESQVVRGVVSEIALAPSRYGTGPDWPIVAEVKLRTDDGLRAFFSPTVGYRNEHTGAVRRAKSLDPVHPWAVFTERGEPVLAVFAGDHLEVVGTVQYRVPGSGNGYWKVSRPKVTALAAPDTETDAKQAPGSSTTPLRATTREVVPTPTTPAPQHRLTAARRPSGTFGWRAQVAVERPDPGDEDPTCKHGNVIYRAGDCDQCDAEEAALLLEQSQDAQHTLDSLEAQAEALFGTW